MLRDLPAPHIQPVTMQLMYMILEALIGTNDSASSGGGGIMIASRAAAFLLRFCALGKRHCNWLVSQGCIPVILTVLTLTQNQIDSVMASQTPALVSQNAALLSCMLPLWCDATGVLVNVTKYVGMIRLIACCDGISTLVRLARRAVPHAKVASAALQALGNIAVLAEDSKYWTGLLAMGVREAFASALAVPTADLADMAMSARAAESRQRGDGLRWMERRDRLELFVVTVLTLGRVLQVAKGVAAMHGGHGPGDLARGLATTASVTCLQQLFRYYMKFD